MEQCGETVNASLDTSFNNTNPSLHSSRLSNGASNSNVSFLKRRLFEDEDEDADVSLLPDEDDEQPSSTVTSTQKPKSPPRCDSETEVRDENACHPFLNEAHRSVLLSIRMIIVFQVRLIDPATSKKPSRLSLRPFFSMSIVHR